MTKTQHFENDDGTCMTCIELGKAEEQKRILKIIKDKVLYIRIKIEDYSKGYLGFDANEYNLDNLIEILGEEKK